MVTITRKTVGEPLVLKSWEIERLSNWFSNISWNGSPEAKQKADDGLKLIGEIKFLRMQNAAIFDPENQPSQFGTQLLNG
jgi:hypothetical protein